MATAKSAGVGSPTVTFLSTACLLALTQVTPAQQAVAPPDQFSSFREPALLGVDANGNGLALAQNGTAIEQSRLYRQTVPSVAVGVDANGTAIAESGASNSDDDSFGDQKILKTQDRVATFFITGSASLIYTDNVALTRRANQSDVFAVLDAGATWTPRLTPTLEGSFGAHVSIFRYDKADDLDFENLGVGFGLNWSPSTWRGASVFARYDFTELLNRDGRQLLMDHTFTLGVQKGISFGRSHSLAFGVNAMVGLSDPGAAQRSQIGAFIGYHLQLTRKLETNFLYRPAVHFYTDSGRTDFNQIISWNMRYRFTEWADLNTNISYGVNRSDEGVFDYNAFTSGASVGVAVRF